MSAHQIFALFLFLGSFSLSAFSPQEPLNRDSIKDSQGQSLSEKIRLASRDYLELRFHEASQRIEEALSLILKNPPYPSLKSDLSQIASLVIVIEEENPTETSALDAFAYRHEIEFQKNISERLRDQWLEQKRAPVTVTQLTGIKDLYLSGELTKFPLESFEGNYLVHALTTVGFKSGWLNLKSSKAPEIRFVSDFKWNSGQPLSYQTKSLPARHNLSPSSGKPLSNSNLWLQSQIAPKSSIDPTDLDMRSESNRSQEQPFYKRTWFWVVVGLAAGAGGYATYQSTRSPTVIKTP